MSYSRDRSAPRRHALVVEHAPLTREMLRVHLGLAGFDVIAEATGRGGLDQLLGRRFDIAILDATTPGIDGLALCRAARSGSPNARTPIVLVSNKGTESDRVLGLVSGADDYLERPFGIQELLARVEAITRRVAAPGIVVTEDARCLAAGDVTLDPGRRVVEVCGRVVELTRQEFDLLHVLLAHRGVVFSRSALVARVSGRRDTTDRAIDSVVSRLRRKLERDPSRPRLILTARGSGYKVADARHDCPA